LRNLPVIVTLLLIVLCSLSACCADDYRIKPGDVLGITVLGEPDLTKHVVVDPKGSISMPLANEVKVLNMTTAQAGQEIAKKLRPFIKKPEVTIELIEAGKAEVAVSGEVRNPGIYPLQNGARLMDAITAAGGYTPKANLSKITVSHSGGDSVTVNLSEFLMGGEPEANIAVKPGDTIFIPTLDTAIIGTVTVVGAVRQTGPFSITKGMTAKEAIMLAGGPTELADTTKVTVRHEGSNEAVSINYTDPSSNLELRPGDVIYVSAQMVLGYYTIQGAVATPGRYEIKGDTSVTEAIAIAGGVRGRAKLGNVRIVRPSEGTSATIKANVSDILAGRAQNIAVKDMDSIYVPAAKERPDYMQILSVAISLGWLLAGR
jgi:polysaccharide biosynthesis/export protein